MTTAIVSITCPHCGGRVDGVRTTNVEQTITCPYCRTELHVPRVGPIVIRERTVMYEPISEPDYVGVLRPKSKHVQWIIAAALVPMFMVMVCVQHEQAHSDIEQLDREQAAEKAARNSCEASCASECRNAGDKETGKWSEFGDQNFERGLKDTDVSICSTDCEMSHNCIGLLPEVLNKVRAVQ